MFFYLFLFLQSLVSVPTLFSPSSILTLFTFFSSNRVSHFLPSISSITPLCRALTTIFFSLRLLSLSLLNASHLSFVQLTVLFSCGSYRIPFQSSTRYLCGLNVGHILFPPLEIIQTFLPMHFISDFSFLHCLFLQPSILLFIL